MTLDQLMLRALANDDQAQIAACKRAAEILVGRRCPDCDGGNVELNETGGTLLCLDCVAEFDVAEEALRSIGAAF